MNSGETVNISGVTITGGDAVSGGGGGINNNGVLTAANDIFTGNSAGGNINVGYVTNSPYGGGGINSTGTLIVNNSTFADNIAGGDGGGIYTTGASTITNSIFNGNTAACAGGIYNNGAETVSGSTFENSIGSFYGGGIWNDYSGTLTVNDSTFANNTVAGTYCAGGAIFGPGAQMIVNNSTFIDNSSQWAGGAICNYTGGEFIVTNSTITNNSAYAGEGGGIQGSLTLNNTIVAGNVGGDISGQVQPTSSNNLIGDGTGITDLPLNSTNLVGTTANPINPMLGPLQNNGGPTETMALLPGSPAISAGNPSLAVDASGDQLTTDQRGAGYPRISDGTVDIGAYELEQITLPTPTVNVVDNGGTYNGTAFVATATVNGQTSLEGVTPTLDYQQYINGAWTDLGAKAPINAGSYDVTANFAGSADYAAASSPTVDFNITPANPPVAFVTTLYQEILGRAPDAAGLTSWVNAVNSGDTAAQIVSSFWNSSEHTANPIGNLNTATLDADNAFINALYQDMLGRTGDTGGIASWDQVLNSNNATPNQAAMDFWNSPEHQAELNAGTAPTNSYGVLVTALYNELLDRSPDIAGLNAWVNAQYSGALTTNQMVLDFAGSAEFTARTSSLLTNQFVTLLYNNILQRAPDTAGLAAWDQALNSSTVSRTQAVFDFWDCPEHALELLS